MKKIFLSFIFLLVIVFNAQAVVYNANTMIKITDSPYSATVTTGSNLLINGTNSVWTNGSPGFDTLTINANHIRIDSLINTAGTTEICTSNTITLTSGVPYWLWVYEAHNSGQHITISGTAGFPTTTLKQGNNVIYWEATSTSLVLTLTNTAAANNLLSIVSYPTGSGLFLMADNATPLADAITAAKTAGKDLYFPVGTDGTGYYYTTGSSVLAEQVKLIGSTRDTSTLITDSAAECELRSQGAKDITLTNFTIDNYTSGSYGDYDYDNIIFNARVGTTYPFIYSFASTKTDRVNVTHSVFNSNNHAMLYFSSPYILTIEDNIFNSGSSNHSSIEISTPLPRGHIKIKNNHIYNGSTGIFFGSNRTYPIENVEIEKNYLYEQTSESIAFDGFGNNASLCPVISNGTIAGVSNDINGRVVVDLTGFKYYGTGANQSWTVSAYATANPTIPLTNFYFSFGQDTGIEGTIAKIYSYDTATNTVTLDLYTIYTDIALGDGGIQAGFFNISVKDNWITHAQTAISMYLNVFNSKIEGNTAIGCNRGIDLIGGLMLSTYQTLAWNNTVQNNNFINDGLLYDVSNPAVWFHSFYSGHLQYNNKFINNTVIGGLLYFGKQGKLTYEGNIEKNTTLQNVP